MCELANSSVADLIRELSGRHVSTFSGPDHENLRRLADHLDWHPYWQLPAPNLLRLKEWKQWAAEDKQSSKKETAAADTQ